MVSKPILKSLAIAGTIAPLLFTALVILQGALQPDYSHVAMPISALEAWPLGWIQRLNFVVTAALLAAFYFSLHQTIQRTRFDPIVIGLLVVNCVGIALAGVFPWINVNGVPKETPPHVVGAVLSFLGASTGLIALSRRMARDPGWQSLATYVLATGIVILLLFITLGAFAIDDGAPLHPWAGLLQRVLCLVWFTCLIVLSLRSMRDAQT